jgi:hypothetical protein
MFSLFDPFFRTLIFHSLCSFFFIPILECLKKIEKVVENKKGERKLSYSQISVANNCYFSDFGLIFKRGAQ